MGAGLLAIPSYWLCTVCNKQDTHLFLYNTGPIKDTIYTGIDVLIVSVRNDESIFSVCQPVIFIRVIEHCCIIIIIFYARLHIVAELG